ncbi:MAG: cellulase family glycosylhydrolase [Phycisphaeraceae bacterium]|nr:cellulase family glycosylhydrolase [Phycisphaeraceae bacterium]
MIRQGPATFTAILLLSMLVAPCARGQSLPLLHVQGHRLVNESGQPVDLPGCNLGNWLAMETWMFGYGDEAGVPDEFTVRTLLARRFGDDAARQVIDIHRENWIKPRDMAAIRSFGFNVVRLPFHHALMEDDDHPMTLRPDAWRWLDRAVDMAEAAGLYVILDLHGAPGGQSTEHHTGRRGENRLWTDPHAQARTIWLWRQIAEHYRGRAAVVAYDLLNEPYGDSRQDLRQALTSLMDKLVAAIRQVDPDKLLLVPGSLQGIACYGQPSQRGWSNVGFTEHFYPGLFGSPSTLESHARFIACDIARRDALLAPSQVPFLVGEYNVVLDRLGGATMMRQYADLYRRRGWMATMWSYKLVKAQPGVQPDAWYMATNSEPWTAPDLRFDDQAVIIGKLTELGTMPPAINEELRETLTQANPSRLALASFPPPHLTAPACDAMPDGFVAVDIGDAVPAGGQLVHQPDRWTIFGGGDDLFHRHDAFRFMRKSVDGEVAMRIVVRSLEQASPFSKAGLMIRATDDPASPHVLIHVFPDGRIVEAFREEQGGLTKEQVMSMGTLPAALKLARRNGEIQTSWTDAEGRWQTGPWRKIAAMSAACFIGVAVLSHTEHTLAAADVDDIRLASTANDWPAVNLDAKEAKVAPNLLLNPSFEEAAGEKDADQAKHWSRWGHWINRETGWEPRHTGQCIMGYHHWEIEKQDSSGLWQDVDGIVSGTRYAFSIYANLDAAKDGAANPTSVELRLESTSEGKQLVVASKTYEAKDIARGSQWSLLHVEGTAPANAMRVLVVVNAGEGRRGGALKLDDAKLSVKSQ